MKFDLDAYFSATSETNTPYFDLEIGEILQARNMLIEEIQDESRFIKLPSQKELAIPQETMENWVKQQLGIVARNYDSDFANKVKSELERAVSQGNDESSVMEALMALQREGLHEGFCDSWLEFTVEETQCYLRQWFASNKINWMNLH